MVPLCPQRPTERYLHEFFVKILIISNLSIIIRLYKFNDRCFICWITFQNCILISTYRLHNIHCCCQVVNKCNKIYFFGRKMLNAESYQSMRNLFGYKNINSYLEYKKKLEFRIYLINKIFCQKTDD